jgi:hypothetical protein
MVIDISATYPIGTRVATTVYSIGGRSERVTGTVCDYNRRRTCIIAQTEFHGRLVIERAKIEAA